MDIRTKLLSVIFVLAACAGALCAAGAADPVWVEGAEKEMNAFYGFSASFSQRLLPTARRWRRQGATAFTRTGRSTSLSGLTANIRERADTECGRMPCCRMSKIGCNEGLV